MLLVYAAAVILLATWIMRSVSAGKVVIPRTPFEIPNGLFVGSQIISTLLSINLHTSLFGYYSRFNGGLYSLLSYVIIFYACLIWITKKNWKSYATTLLWSGILTALYAFPEHFGHSPSCYLITGSFTADCWIQDVQTRIFGTLGQPNWLAAYMTVLIPFSVAGIASSLSALLETKEIILKRYAIFSGWIITFMLFCLVLLFTKSRSGLLGVGIGLLLFFLLTAWQMMRTRQKATTVGVSALLLVTYVVLIFSIANPVRDKLEQLIHVPSLGTTSQSAPAPRAVGTQLDSGGSESGDIRKVVWTGAVRVWLRYPIFGSGVETFAYSYYQDRPQAHNLLSEWDFLYNKAHNEFLNYLATTGAVGLITYVLMYGSFIVLPIFWTYKKDTPLAVHSSLFAVSSALLGLAVSNFFGFSTVVVSLLTFVLPAMTLILAERAKTSSFALPKQLTHKNLLPLVHSVVMVACLSSLFSIYRIYAIDVDYAHSKSLIDQKEVDAGVAMLQSVVDQSPDEPVYRDELAYTAARLSYALGATGDSTSSGRLGQAAIDHSDEVLRQNHVNVNFFKTRARIFTLLGQLTPAFYPKAVETLKQARALSPTDSKLPYNLAIIAKAQGDIPAYEAALLETLTLRPIDLQARQDLATLYEDQKKYDAAKQMYAEMVKLDPSNKAAKDRIASLSATPKKKV